MFKQWIKCETYLSNIKLNHLTEFYKMNRHSKPQKWRRLSSRVVFTHPRMILAEDEVELPDGKRSLYLRQVYQEESNILAEDFQQIGWFYADNRRTSAKLYVVCARGAFRDNYSLQPDETEFISSSWLEINKLEQMISNGQIVNYSMLAAWALFKTAPMK